MHGQYQTLGRSRRYSVWRGTDYAYSRRRVQRATWSTIAWVAIMAVAAFALCTWILLQTTSGVV